MQGADHEVLRGKPSSPRWPRGTRDDSTTCASDTRAS
jgi:hypothetical protein